VGTKKFVLTGYSEVEKLFGIFLQHRVHSHRKIRIRNTCPNSCGKAESAVFPTSQLIVTKTVVDY